MAWPLPRLCPATRFAPFKDEYLAHHPVLPGKKRSVTAERWICPSRMPIVKIRPALRGMPSPFLYHTKQDRECSPCLGRYLAIMSPSYSTLTLLKYTVAALESSM